MKPFFSEQYEDIYFNPENPEAEKDFVFIQGNDLRARLLNSGDMVVAELGFGYGLNCALLIAAVREAKFSHQLHFFSVEEKLPTFNAACQLLPKLTRSRDAYAALWQHRDAIAQGETVRISNVCVTVFPGQVEEFLARQSFRADAWFLDGFAPAKNPAMWSESVMAAVYARTRHLGTFATYSCAGWVRRNLVSAGFQVQKVAGFAGKRAMLSGIKISDAEV